MQTRELKERKQVRSRKLKEEVVPEDKLVEELQCDYCHCFTYLSYIGCKCTDKVVCHEHISEVKVTQLNFTFILISVYSCVHVTFRPKQCIHDSQINNSRTLQNASLIQAQVQISG